MPDVAPRRGPARPGLLSLVLIAAACSSSEEGYFLSADEEVAVELQVASDSDAVDGRFWLFPGPTPFAAERFEIVEGALGVPPAFSALVRNLDDPGEVFPLEGALDDLDSDGRTDRVRLGWVRADGVRRIAATGAIPEIAYAPYKCWEGPGGCVPGLGALECTIGAPVAEGAEVSFVAAVPFRHADGELTPGTLRFRRERSDGSFDEASGALPGSFALGEEALLTSTSAADDGEVAVVSQGWRGDTRVAWAVVEVLDAQGEASNAVRCPATSPTVEEAKLEPAGPLPERFGSAIALDGSRVAVGAPGTNELGGAVGAAYVFEPAGRGAWSVTRLLASDASELAYFGARLDLAGDRLAVGAYLSDQVYVFERDLEGWAETAILARDGGAPGERFGSSVALEGDTLMVGAVFDAGAGARVGSVTHLERVDGSWEEVTRLVPAEVAVTREFGQAIALEGDRVVVGAAGGSASRGRAFVFERGLDPWSEVQMLEPAEPIPSFGISVALDGDRLAIGASQDGVAVFLGGAVHLYERIGGTWQLVQRIVPPDPSEQQGFGGAVALDGDTLVIGAYEDDFRAANAGAVYVYREVEGVWTDVAKLLPRDGVGTPDPYSGDLFGAAVALDADTIAAGAVLHDVSQNGPGATYLYARPQP